jgi:hypothetical protein
MAYQPNLSTPISYDASNRLRVGQLTTLGDLKTLSYDDTLLLENVGTGTQVWGTNKCALAVASNGQYSIRRSKQYFPYFSGKSQQIEITQDNFQTETNVIKRVGYFSSAATGDYSTVYDGIMLEDDGTTKRLKTFRAGVETLNVAIADWNGDPYLQTYDWSKFTVLEFDFLWLGGANLRLFVKTDRGFTLAHTHSHAGLLTDLFMLSPNQTVRWEIRSTGGTGQLNAICAQVSTEGSINESGKQRSVSNGSTGVILAAIGTTYPILAVRKSATHRTKSVKLFGAGAFVTTANDQLLISLHLNPTLSAPLTYGAVANSAVESAVGNGTITATAPGTVLYSAYLAQNSILPANILDMDFLSYIGMSIADVSDQLVLCGTPVTASITTLGVLNFKEF